MTVVVPTGLEGLQQAFATLGAGIGSVVFEDHNKKIRTQEFIRQNPQIGALLAPVLDEVDRQIGEDEGLMASRPFMQQSAVRDIADLFGFHEGSVADLTQLAEAWRSARTVEERAAEADISPESVAQQQQLLRATRAGELAEQQERPTEAAAAGAQAREQQLGAEARMQFGIPLQAAAVQVQQLRAAGFEADLASTVNEFKAGLAGDLATNFEKLDPELQELFSIAAVDTNVLEAMLRREGFDLQRELLNMQLSARTAAGIDPLKVAEYQIRADDKLSKLVEEFKAAKKGDALQGELDLIAARINSHISLTSRILGSEFANTYSAEARNLVRRWAPDVVGFDVLEVDVNPQLVSDQESRELIAGAVSIALQNGISSGEAFNFALERVPAFQTAAEGNPSFRAAFEQTYQQQFRRVTQEQTGTVGVGETRSGSSLRNFILGNQDIGLQTRMFEAILGLPEAIMGEHDPTAAFPTVTPGQR